LQLALELDDVGLELADLGLEPADLGKLLAVTMRYLAVPFRVRGAFACLRLKLADTRFQPSDLLILGGVWCGRCLDPSPAAARVLAVVVGVFFRILVRHG